MAVPAQAAEAPGEEEAEAVPGEAEAPVAAAAPEGVGA
jgi:hypothetical protein